MSCGKIRETTWKRWFQGTRLNGTPIRTRQLLELFSGENPEGWMAVDCDSSNGEIVYRARRVMKAEEVLPLRVGKTRFLVFETEHGFERIVRFTEATLYVTGEVELGMVKKDGPNSYTTWTTLYLLPVSLWQRIAGTEDDGACKCNRSHS